MVVDILGSILSGMPWGPHINRMYGDLDNPRRLGHLFLAIEVRRFLPIDEFKATLKDMTTELTSLEAAEGFVRVCYPGQRSGECRSRRAKYGIRIDAGLYTELQCLGETFGVVI